MPTAHKTPGKDRGRTPSGVEEAPTRFELVYEALQASA
jgi:hypothetical protein